MTSQDFLKRYGTWYPGAFYGDAHPSGAQVRLYANSHLETNYGRVEFPSGAGLGVLFPMLTTVGGFRFAGQLHGTPNTNAEWAWTPEGGRWTARPSTFEGHTPCIYDLDGRLWQNGLDEFVGSPGYRGIGARDAENPGGRRIAADETTLLLEAELSAYSTIGPDLVIGQGHPDAAKDHCWIWHRPTKKHRLLVEAPCWFIRATVGGDSVALYIPVIDKGAWVVMCPISALLELDVKTMPGAPLPQAIGPLSAPRSQDGRLYDLVSFIVGGPATWPRRGPTHPMHQALDPMAPDGRGRLFHYVKFGDVVPSGEAYETWGYDEHWLYHLEDASGHHAGPYSFDDVRWFPRHMAIGEAHAFDTREHQTTFRDRGSCQVVQREPFRRRMWVEAVYDRFYWGPDLGERATMVIAYDPTAGIHIPERGVELGYYAHGAGSVRWEWFHSDRVYPKGATRAQFTEAARGARSDFYLTGGPALRPKLTGCVPQVVPHLPPLTTTEPEEKPDPKEETMVAYGLPILGFQPGDTHDNGDGTVSVKKPNGKWLCVTPEGQIEERDGPGGPWESFKRTSTSLVALRDTRTYVLPLVDLGN